ncbi:MAG: zinc-binding dehydrogenase [Proteobacteria bacterium]|nr:zinc-binding dehydrogenase [Pseudomonadota bacterium]
MRLSLTRAVLPRPNQPFTLVTEEKNLTPGKGQVLIQTHAASLNFADVIIQRGLYDAVKKYGGYPLTPGFDLSGTVLACGKGVKHLKPGMRIIALTRFGAFSSHLVLPATQVFPMPQNLSFEQAASLPTVFLTAAYALRQGNPVQPPQSVLIYNAAGGVGQAAIQIAKAQKLTVTALVSSTQKAQALKHLGVRTAIGTPPKGQDFDLILNPAGGQALRQSKRHLAQGGTLVIYGFNNFIAPSVLPRPLALLWRLLTLPLFSPFPLVGFSQRIVGFNLIHWFGNGSLVAQAMHPLLALFKAGKLTPLPSQTFALNDINTALAWLASPQSTGKVVITFPRATLTRPLISDF